MPSRPLTIMNIISGDGRGGSDRLAMNLSKALKDAGHRVIWASPSYCYLIKEAKENGIETFNPYPSGSNDMKGIPSLIKYCANEGVDIVNAHHSHARHMLLMSKFRGLKTKLVFTRHCLFQTIPHLGALSQNLLVDMNIAVSDVVKKSLIRYGIMRSKVVRVYGGIDLDRFGNISQDKIGDVKKKHGKNSAFNIGIVARAGLHRDRTDKPTMKRHEVLFKALADIMEDFNLLVLGTDDEKVVEGLKMIAKDNGLNPGKITFCGFQEQIAPFYKIMDINVLPSLNEGLGLALIEGMAAGVPCIGADSGGLKEIITDGKDGLLFRPGDSKDLAGKVKLLLADKDKREYFALNGREKVKKLFDIRKNAAETEKIFYNLLD